ncbi:hypothetical protein BGLA2_200002 [Burkholderia gladioli]|nr:hypothetical protein BGLA2_200002 [Burkholderia gladioli]
MLLSRPGRCHAGLAVGGIGGSGGLRRLRVVGRARGGRLVVRDAGLRVDRILVARGGRVGRLVRDVDRDVVGDRLRMRIEDHRQHDHRGHHQRDRADQAPARALFLGEGRVEHHRVRGPLGAARGAPLDSLAAYGPGAGFRPAPGRRVVVFLLAEREDSHVWLVRTTRQCCCDLR